MEERDRHAPGEPNLKAPESLRDSQLVLESVDRELSFYRKRSGQVYFFGLVAEAGILAGQRIIVLPQSWTWESALVYSVFFLAVALVGILLGDEYRRRIHILKDARLELLHESGYEHAFPTRSQQKRSEIGVLFLVLVFLSSAGIFLTWVNWYASYH